MRQKWWVAMAGLVLVGVMGMAPALGVGATESKEAVAVRLVVDGAVVGTFTQAAAIKMETEVIEMVCRADGGDNDCDDTDTEAWQADVLKRLWGMEATAGTLEEQAWFSSRARHDIAMNAIRNMKGLAHEVAHTVQQSSSVRGRHDTVKNAIGNIRAVYRVLSSIAIDEPGVHAAIEAMGADVNGLTALAAQTAVKKRPGRPTYGNITLEGRVGENPGLFKWVTEVRDGKTWRKSGSIIYLDRTGAEVLRYNLFECWPVAYSADMAIEKIEIAVEKVERAK